MHISDLRVSMLVENKAVYVQVILFVNDSFFQQLSQKIRQDLQSKNTADYDKAH